MKKIFLSSMVLIVFAFSIILFQISCQKEINAQTASTNAIPATTSTLGSIIVGNGLSVTSNGTLSVTCCNGNQANKIIFLKALVSGTAELVELWSANYDGTNPQKINISIPSGMNINEENAPLISPDHETIFFTLINTTTEESHIYSVKTDGTNLLKVIDGKNTTGIVLGSAY